MIVVNNKCILSFFLVLVVSVANAQWVRTAKSRAFARSNAVATGQSGSVYTAGIFSCITSFDGDSLLNNSCGEITPPAPAVTQVDAFLAKRDENGALLWVRHFPGSAGNKLFINDIGVDAAGNCYVTGAYAGDLDLTAVQLSNPDPTTEFFLVKILADGSTDWAVSYAADNLSESSAQKVAVTQNAVYITGSVRGDFQVGALVDSVGKSASFIASFDLAGGPLWARNFMEINANGSSRGKAIEAKGDSIWVFSSFTDSVRIGGSVFRPPGTAPTTTAGVICLYNAAGNLLNQMLTNTPFVEGIKLHRPDGSIYITGRAENITAINGDTIFNNAGIRAYVSSHSLDVATVNWVTSFTASTATALSTTDLEVNNNGSIYVAGMFQGTTLNGPTTSTTGGGGLSGFLLKLDNTGFDQWLQSYGGSGDDALLSVSSTDDDQTFIGGYFSQYIRVAGDEVYTASGNGMTARIDICPQLIAERVTADTIFICERDTAIFEVTNNAAYTYQWYRDGTTIPGAITSDLEVAEVGTYVAQVTNAGCSKFTPAARLFLNPLPDSVVLTNDPMENCEGDDVKLIGPVGAYTFQWLDGATLLTETLKDILVTSDGDYQLQITDSEGCSILSDTFAIRFHSYPSAALTPAGGNYTLCSGNSLVLQADQSQPGMTWQWRKNDLPLSGEVFSNYEATESGIYHAVIRNAIGCETITEPDTVVVQASPLIDINDEDLPGQICQGTILRLVTPLVIGQNYQWQKDGADISGETTNVLDVGSEGQYAVRVNNAMCAKVSDPFDLVVNALPVASILNDEPAAICEGDSYVLNAQEATGYAYQWLNNNQELAGEEQPALPIVMSGNYSLRITNQYNCQHISPPTSVIVKLKPPASVTPQGPTTICEGTTVALSTNPGTLLSYQWIRDGVPIPSQTQDHLEVSENASFQVRVTNSSQCSRLSAAVQVQVVPNPTATLVSETGMNSVCERDSVKLIAGSLPSYDFAWLFNDQPANASSSMYFAKQAGSYRVVASVANCRDTSTVLQLQIKENPMPVITRNEAFLSIALFGDIQWYHNEEAIPGATLQSILAEADGEYRVNVVNAAGCSAWSSTVPLCQPIPEIQRTKDVLTVSIAAEEYSWMYEDLPIEGAALRQLTAQQSGSYSVVVVSRDGCTMETQPVTVCIPYPFISRDEFTGVLFASPNPASAYQWFFEGTGITGATTQVHIPDSPGGYSVEVQNLDGCTSSSEVFSIAPVTGIEQRFSQQIALFPNPATNTLRIQISDKTDRLKVWIRDATGKEVRHFEISDHGHDVDLSDMRPGIYTVIIRRGEHTATWKLVRK